MRWLLIIFVVIFSVPSIALAYPRDQFKDCLESALQNPAIDGVSQDSVENYCDCALKLIVDEGRNRRSSGYECALKSFG